MQNRRTNSIFIHIVFVPFVNICIGKTFVISMVLICMKCISVEALKIAM